MFKKLIVVSPRLLKILSGNFARGMALFPFILLQTHDLKLNKQIINHELIHIRQQIELLVIPFYLWYLIEYLIKRIKYKSHYLAYKNLSFEREAYANEEDFGYLKTRKFWAFLKYL